MFGAVPGVFKNLLAVTKTAKAYGLEEKNTWIVVYKRVEGTTTPFFKPCCKEDLDQAIKEGYKEVDLRILETLADLVDTNRRDYFVEDILNALQGDKGAPGRMYCMSILTRYGFPIRDAKVIVDNNFDKWVQDYN
jgi:hypothetical protein